MKNKSFIFLINKECVNEFTQIIKKYDINNFVFCSTLTEMEQLEYDKNSIIISYGTSTIVPKNILSTALISYNIHSASPEFPGRDPHNWAIYRKSRQYGATLHLMSPNVDSGRIIKVKKFSVKKHFKPCDLLKESNNKSIELFTWLLEQLCRKNTLPPEISTMKWGKIKTSRKDLKNICHIEQNIAFEELHSRIKSFHSNKYDNFHINIAGYHGKITNIEQTDYSHWNEFTESNYIQILEKAKNHYKICSLLDKKLPSEPHIILRHDVDYSTHDALRIAKSEASRGIKSSYFILPYSDFYDIRNKNNIENVIQIQQLGHDIALHFSTDICKSKLSNLSELEKELSEQKQFLENYLGIQINAFSFHNPTSDVLKYKQYIIAGMVNAYSDYFNKYKYTSDSNGYYRFEPIPSVISSKEHKYIYILTHPLWWSSLPLPPREKIKNTLLKHSVNKILEQYDDTLKIHSRKNYNT